ncbi:MAG TPA: 4a-hydroxytetrahydrobiopterin dehydratase [Candidatus Eisenbacteria bacterium]|nr:4a-hydroxytetrahydrobiopterin dehydratase [Candidatus Eisenbacteria bacterium]
MARLADEALARELTTLPGWVVEGGMLRKAFRHPSFPEAIVFVNAVAHLAEAANHHPDVDIRYSTISVALVTHDEGGITGKDVALAREIEDVRKRAGAA